MGIVVGGIIVAGGAAASWLVGAILSRRLDSGWMRWVGHVAATSIIFFAFGSIILLALGLGDAVGIVFSFVGIMMVAAMADGAVGAWFDHRSVVRQVSG